MLPFVLPLLLSPLTASLTTAHASSSSSLTSRLLSTCETQSHPNPIAAQYPNDVTGTINGTTAIVPIPYAIARGIVPAKYGILKTAYQSLIPGIGEDVYPAEFEGVLDHDVRMGEVGIADFQASIDHPPCPVLFRYTAPPLVSLNVVALLGSAFYGETVLGTFDPPCDGYASERNSSTTYLSASQALSSSPSIEGRLTTVDSIPFSQKLFINITNQPSFGSGVQVCDNYITLYNSSVTQGQYAPDPVRGTVKVVPPYYPVNATLEAYGYRMDNSFVERNDVPCENLKGYSASGAGD